MQKLKTVSTKLNILLLGVLFLLACKKTEPYQSDLGYAYFPVEQGSFIEYHVLDIRHDEDLIPVVDTTEYFLKVTVGEKILSNTGDSINKLFFYIKPHIDSAYVLDKVNSIYRDDLHGIYNIDNQKVVKLSFPAQVTRTWDMNSFNTLDKLTSTITHKDFSGTVEGILFPSLMRTEQLDFFSLVDHQKAYEIYAKDIGLVRVYYKDLVIQNFDTLDIRRGRELYWDYISHGVE